jgi:cytosine/adenosine deaminase-related metal-dependent hydrolase
VFPVTGDPIPDGTVSIKGGRIISCGAGVSLALQAHERCDLGNVAILPGLVNAHVHLDFSDLAAPLGQRGMPFVDWIRRVIEFRRQTVGLDRHPLALGLSESLRSGVATLGDIASFGWSADDYAASPLGVTVFQELIAPTDDRVATAVELAKSHLNVFGTRRVPLPHTACAGYPSPLSPREREEGIAVGLSPHAPYSVHPKLLAAAIELSNEHQVPLAMHLAESREELELLRHGGGPLRGLLADLGAWDPAVIPLGTRPLDYLRLLASADSALVIHGNYLDDEEIAFLAENRGRMAVVYCPRTHDWFAHDAYPLEKMFGAGVTVALGTDGRGSAPDLNLLAEMRFTARRHPAVRLDDILKMGTIYGARALGQEALIGSLAPGKRADLTIVPLPDRDAADPHELLFDSDAPASACYCRGVRMF